jgi:phage tail-like protein
MAQIENPRKVFNFSIQVANLPINPWLAQEVDIPEESLEVVSHGDTNHDIKTAGRHMYGNMTIRKLMLTSGSDNYFFDWMASCSDVLLGGGLTPTAYKRTLIITELAEDGGSIINTWIATGCFPSRRSAIALKRTSSDNTIEEVELSIDTLEKV